MATAAAATPAARAGESSAQATATTSAATALAYHWVLLGGSTAATGAATGVGCLRGGVGGGRLGLVWVSLHGERQNISRLELFCVATSLSTSYASYELVRSQLFAPELLAGS